MGGQQSIIRSAVIKQENGYLGPHACTLNPGNVQCFVFGDDDDGPFWMMERIRTERKEDKVVEGIKKVKNVTKAELMDKLCKKEYLLLELTKK
jgi:hypothetical protein